MAEPSEHKDVVRRRASERKRRTATFAKWALAATGIVAVIAWLVLLAS